MNLFSINKRNKFLYQTFFQMLLQRFPNKFQMNAKDCSPACLKIIAKYYGKYYSLQHLRDLCGITREGVSFLDISYAARQIGLRSVSVKATPRPLDPHLAPLHHPLGQQPLHYYRTQNRQRPLPHRTPAQQLKNHPHFFQVFFQQTTCPSESLNALSNIRYISGYFPFQRRKTSRNPFLVRGSLLIKQLPPWHPETIRQLSPRLQYGCNKVALWLQLERIL